MRTGSTAIDAFIVVVCFGDFEEFGSSFGIDLPHFTAHIGGTVVGVGMCVLKRYVGHDVKYGMLWYDIVRYGISSVW